MPAKSLDNAAVDSSRNRRESQEARGGSYFFIGEIADTFPHAGCYLVRTPLGSIFPAVDLQHTPGLPVGSRSLDCYPVKTRVLVMHDRQFDPALLILGAVPRQVADSRLILPDSLVMRSRVGIFEDPLYYTEPVGQQSFLGNFSAGRPADVLPGDWGAVNDLGMAILLSRADMVMMRASDAAGIQMFRSDSLLRMLAYNYEFADACTRDYRLNDEGEFNTVRRETPFPWEGMGLFTRGDPAADEVNGKLKTGSEEAKHEPRVISQLIVPRRVVLGGSLGEIEREYICLPPETESSQEEYGLESKYRGVADIHKGLDGSLSTRSAKSIRSIKYCLIPVPKEMKAPEDPTGDRLENYKASDPDEDRAEFDWGEGEDAGIRPSLLFDHHTWLLNKQASATVSRHKKDWYLPEESDLGETAVDEAGLNIGHSFRAGLPDFDERTIGDQANQKVKYFKSRSVIEQLDDGSIILEDAYGSRIVMSAGNIELSAVGDVWVRAGRNIINWAPHDAIIRAGNSAELTAAKKDVRIKAEQNVHVLAGNSGDAGGVLIECRSDGGSKASDFESLGEEIKGHGVVIKTTKSPFQVFARDFYIGKAASDSEGDQEGIGVVDVGLKGEMLIRGKKVSNRVVDEFNVLTKPEEGSRRECFSVREDKVTISTDAEVGGNLTVAPSATGGVAEVIIGGGITVHGGGTFNGGVTSNQGFAAIDAPDVGELDSPVDLGEPPETLGAEIAARLDEVETSVDDVETPTDEDEDTAPAHQEYQQKIGFSCRPTEQVKLDESTFLLYETAWQKRLRAGESPVFWDEPVVISPNGEKTRPHPGHDAWENWSAYVTVDDKNTDGKKSVAREEIENSGGAPDPKSLVKNYVINVQE